MKKRDIIIVTICIATALICITLTWWGNYKNNGVLSPDAFYGVLATFIGICTTIIVGFQIASFVKIHETEQQIKKVQAEREKLEKEINDIKAERSKMQAEFAFIEKELGNTLILLSETTNKYDIKIISNIISSSSERNANSWDLKYPEILLRRYKVLRKNLLSADKKDIKIASNFTYKLKDVKIPQTIPHYVEIMKLHLEIIEMLDNAAKEQEQTQRAEE